MLGFYCHPERYSNRRDRYLCRVSPRGLDSGDQSSLKDCSLVPFYSISSSFLSYSNSYKLKNYLTKSKRLDHFPVPDLFGNELIVPDWFLFYPCIQGLRFPKYVFLFFFFCPSILMVKWEIFSGLRKHPQKNYSKTEILSFSSFEEVSPWGC